MLHLNEGWAEHSVWRPHQVLTGGYWDQFLLARIVPTAGPAGILAMIGYAGGTVGRAYGLTVARPCASRASSSTPW